MALRGLKIDGIPVAYIDEGQGPPVILAHCSSASHRMWQALIDELKNRYRVLAPDLIGYGASGRWPPERPFDASADARTLVELARIAGEPTHFAGHSYGGAMCLEAVRRLGGVARGMTLIEPVAFPLLRTAGRISEWRTIERVADAVNAAIAKGDRRGAAAAYMGFWLGTAQWWMAPKKLKQNVLETVEKVALEFQAGKDLEMASLDGIDVMTLPVLLLQGAKTRKPAKAVVEILAEALTNSRVEIIAGAGHMSPITHRDQVNAILRQHIDDCASQDSAP